MRVLNSKKKRKVDKMLKELQDYINDVDLDEWLAEGPILPILPPMRINFIGDKDEEDDTK